MRPDDQPVARLPGTGPVNLALPCSLDSFIEVDLTRDALRLTPDVVVARGVATHHRVITNSPLSSGLIH